MKRTYLFNVSTRYVGSEVTEEIELEFDDDLTEGQIDRLVQEEWAVWRAEQCDGGYELLKQEQDNP